MVLEKLDLTEAIRFLEDRIIEVTNKCNKEIDSLNEEIKNIEKKKDNSILELKQTLIALRNSNTVCEKCKGNKQVRKTDDLSDVDWKICDYCNGTGLSIKNKRVG